LAEAAAAAVVQYNQEMTVQYGVALSQVTFSRSLFLTQHGLLWDKGTKTAKPPASFNDSPDMVQLVHDSSGRLCVRCLVCQRAGGTNCDFGLPGKAEKPGRFMRNFKSRHARAESHINSVLEWRGLGKRRATQAEQDAAWVIAQLCNRECQMSLFVKAEGDGTGYKPRKGLYEDAGLQLDFNKQEGAVITATHSSRNKGETFTFKIHPTHNLLTRIRAYCEKTAKIAQTSERKDAGLRLFFRPQKSPEGGSAAAVASDLSGRATLPDGDT